MRAEPATSPRTGARLVGSILLLLTTHGIAGPDSAPGPGSPARNAVFALFDSARVTVDTNPATSLRYALQGLSAARTLGDRRLQALGNQHAGEAYFQVGANDSAEACHLRALELARSISDDSLTAAALNGMTLMAYIRGELTLSLQHGFEALTFARRAGLTLLAVRIQNHLGLAARDFGASVSDIGFFRRALGEAIALADTEGIAITRNHLGSWWASHGRPDSALFHYYTALSLRMLTAPRSNSVAVLYNNIGNVYRLQRRYDEARDSYERSLAISMRTGSRNLIATAYKNMAILARERGDLPRALAYAREAKAISMSIGLSRVAVLSAEEIALTLAAQGEFRPAYDSLRAFIGLRDSLENAQHARHLAELQVRFESDRKEQTIQQLALQQARTVRNYLIALIALTAILGLGLVYRYREKSRTARELAARQDELEHLYAALVARNEQLQVSASHLRDSLQEKDVLLKEIHHRVKNNLQVVSSLLSLQSDSITDERSRNLMHESQDRIRAMALVHERLYRSNDFSRIELDHYLADLVEHLRISQGNSRVEISVTTEHVPVSLDTAIPLGLIVSELVTNAIKHGFPGYANGTVQVTARRDQDGRGTVTVEDSGRGLPPGFDVDRAQTLGLHLVHILVEQIDGTLTVINGSGTRIAVTFPLARKV